MTSQIQVNLNPQSVSQRTHPEVAKQLLDIVERGRCGVILQWLGWSSHSLAYGLTPMAKPNQAHSVACALALRSGTHPEAWLFSES